MPESSESTQLKQQEAKSGPLIKGAVLAGLAIIASSFFFLGGGVDQEIPVAENEANIQAFSAVGVVKLQPVKPNEMSNALQSLSLPPDSMHELSQNIAQPTTQDVQEPEKWQEPSKLRMAWVEVWDFARVDGDVVSVSSAGFSTQVLLGRSPTRVAVPVSGDGVITIAGVKDGGGGITLGIRSGGGTVSLPLLMEGQNLVVPVGF